MSYYATIGGYATYPDHASMLKVVSELKDKHWMKRNDRGAWFVDEMGEFMDLNAVDGGEGPPNADFLSLTLTFPLGLYRNLARMLDIILVGTKGTVVCTSTDGCFEGTVYQDGVATTNYNLAEWWKKEGDGEPVPDDDKEFEAYCEWMSNVEREFLEEFLP